MSVCPAPKASTCLRVRRVAADDDTVIGLRELVALRRIVEEVCEVREQREIGVHGKELNGLRRARADVAVRARQAVALRRAAVCRVELPEARDESFFDRAEWNLVARVPAIVIRQSKQREPRRRRTPGVPRQSAELPNALGNLPRSVVGFAFAADEEISASNGRRRSRREAHEIALSVRGARKRTIELTEQMELRTAGAAEVADLGVIDAELVVDVVDEFWNEKIQIGIALPVPVGRKVERHALETRLKIGAVIEVEAANEILVRLPFARVLGDDHPGHRLEQLALARDRAEAQICRADASLGRAGRDAAQVVDPPHHFDGIERRPARGVRRLCAQRRSLDCQAG